MGYHNDKADLFASSERIEDPGDANSIYCGAWGAICDLVTGSSGQTRTLLQPIKSGTMVVLNLKTDGGGDCVITVTGGYNQAGDTSITLADAGDWVAFYSIDVGGSYYWRVLQEEGTNIVRTNLTVDTLSLGVSTVAAAGSAIGDAAALSEGFNLVTAADNTKGVQLPAATAGKVVFVMSGTVNRSLPVYPPTSGTINNGAANVASTLAAATAYTSGIFVAYNTTGYYSFPSDSA